MLEYGIFDYSNKKIVKGRICWNMAIKKSVKVEFTGMWHIRLW